MHSGNRWIVSARVGCSAIGFGGLMVMGSGSALAQTQVPSQGEISRERLKLPPVESPRFSLRIQAPDRSAVPKAIDAVEFQLDDVVVEGATAFPKDVIDGYFAKVKGKRVGLAAVREAALALEGFYRDRGYFLTRVFIAPQPVTNSMIKVTVIEGFIEDVTVEGLDEGTRNAVRSALLPLLERKPIDLPTLERRLLVLNDMPGISGTSVLRPGTQIGGSSLIVTLDAPADGVQFAVNNAASRILGPWNYALNANLNRPFNLPGSFNVGISAGGRDLKSVQTISGRYSVGLGNNGLITSFGILAAKAEPGGTVRPLEIRNMLLSFSARARYPIVRSRSLSLFLEGGLSVNRSDTDILGQPLIRDRTTVLDGGLSLQQNGWLDGATTLSGSIYQGLPIFGAIGVASPAPSTLNFDPDFTRFTYSVQRQQKLPGRFSGLFAFQGQFTNSKLLSGELVSFGGQSIGRGFDPSSITGDRGYGGLIELRYDLPITKAWLTNAQFYGFIDGARTISIATVAIPKSTQSIRSAGGGVRVAHRYGVVDFQVAYAHRQLGGADERANPRALISAVFAY